MLQTYAHHKALSLKNVNAITFPHNSLNLIEEKTSKENVARSLNEASKLFATFELFRKR